MVISLIRCQKGLIQENHQMSAPILPKSCSLIALFQRQHMFFNFENKVWQWRIGGWGTLGTVLLWTNVRKSLACGPSLENVMFLHTQDSFFLANPLFLPSIAFDLPLPNFWITISAISITIDRGLIS